ncbi:hypothetical protein D3C85_1423110 [compost metagenome]
MKPAIGNGRLAHFVLLRQPQPAKQQAATLTVLCRLRRVELEATIQLMKIPVRKLRPVESAHQPATLMEVEIVILLRGNALWAADQHMAIR